MTEQRRQLVIVDLCGTLVSEDTTIGLLRYHFSRQGSRTWRRLFVGATALQAGPLRFAMKATERVTRRHLLKGLLVRALAGEPVLEVEASAREYAEMLIRRRRAAVDELLREASPSRLVVASASIEPIVSAVASLLGAEYVASELQVKDGAFTGLFEHDLTGRKLDALRDLCGEEVDVGDYVAISDNIEDRYILENARRAYVVLREASHRARWGDLAATYIVP
jgi:phosphoserine phosphatase